MAHQSLVILLLLCVTVLAIVYSKSLSRVKRWQDVQDLEFRFSCRGKSVGFYADVDHNCQVFHICDNFGRRIPMICPNETVFNQEYRVCDWEYNVNCEDAVNWYYLNDYTYEKTPSTPPEDENSGNNVKK